jgi:hypothetical protein
MTLAKALRWWPAISILAMVLLALAVGKGSTPIDDWFTRTGATHPGLAHLVWFTYPPMLFTLLVLATAVALWRRRWRLATVVVLTPLLALIAEQVLKRLFGRYKAGGLAYPSGHVTLTIVVLGMLLLVVGAKVWLLVSASVVALLALLGVAFTFHYFTDTVGAVFLGTALVCIAVQVAGLDRCQPHCDLDHTDS